MLKGKTKSGFEYEIPEENLNNYELLEALAEVEENPLIMPKTIKLLLGEEQAKKLKDHVRKKNGIVPTDKLSKEIQDIFENHKETKNS